MPSFTNTLRVLAAGSLLSLFAACSKHDKEAIIAPPADLAYAPANAVTLKGRADTSSTPTISWNGKKGQFAFAGSVPQGVTIDASTGKISWPSSLAIGGYIFPVVASNGAPGSDTVSFTLTVSGPITTIAGSTQGFSGDGNTALNAQFNQPSDLTVDADGNIYIADSYNNRIRRIAKDGTITTIAGDGSFGFSGDNGLAVKAQISGPNGIINDNAGNLYVTDYGNNRIRRIDASGKITTVAGSTYSTAYYLGDEGPATSAGLYLLAGKVALGNDGSLYIADYGNQRIRQVTPDGIMHTIAGSGRAGLVVPDGTPARSADIGGPASVYFDASKNSLYIATIFSVMYQLRQGNVFDLAGTDPVRNDDPAAGDGAPAINANLVRLSNIAVDKDGNIFFNDFANNRVRRISPDGIITTVAGNGKYGFSGDGGPAAAATLAHPYGLAVDSNGDLYIADTNNNRIRKVTLH